MTHVDRYTCEEVFRRLNDYLDRELTPEETALMEGHLATCAQCASEHEFERAVLEEIKDKLRRVSAPASLIAKVQAALTEEEKKR